MYQIAALTVLFAQFMGLKNIAVQFMITSTWVLLMIGVLNAEPAKPRQFNIISFALYPDTNCNQVNGCFIIMPFEHKDSTEWSIQPYSCRVLFVVKWDHEDCHIGNLRQPLLPPIITQHRGLITLGFHWRNGCHFAGEIFKRIFLNENSFQFPIHIPPALVQIMA